jgi:hypothetical protein
MGNWDNQAVEAAIHEQKGITPKRIEMKWKGLDKAERLLAVAIARRRSTRPDESRGWAKMSMEQLKDATKMSEATIRAAIDRLSERDILQTEMKGIKAGSGHKNSYRLHDIAACYEDAPKKPKVKPIKANGNGKAKTNGTNGLDH